MKPFVYVRPSSIEAALATDPDAAYLGGGTTLVDLMRLEVMQPKAVVELRGLPLAAIEATPTSLRIGALATNEVVAYHPIVVERFPALSEALLAGASPQVRNVATVGGNLLQRTRCPYFRDLGTPCNKRRAGSGCSAIGGYSRPHAVLGTSDLCIATHPSDMCVALAALDAVVHVRGGDTTRAIPFADLHTTPDARPHVESVLAPGELITHLELPVTRIANRSRYLKVRDRAAFAFALASAAAALEIRAGRIQDARLALGGIATKPWRAVAAEKALIGSAPSTETFRLAAAVALEGARTTKHNEFKVELAKRTIVRALARSADEGGAA